MENRPSCSYDILNSPLYEVNERNFEHSDTFKKLWDVFHRRLNSKNKLFNFYTKCEQVEYKEFYNKPIPNYKDYTYFDLDTLIHFQKGLDSFSENYKYRRENILLFTSVYSKNFFTHQANPHQPFESKFNNIRFAEAFTLNCGIDVLVTNVHSKLILVPGFSPFFKKNQLFPHLNNLISTLTRITLNRKSDLQVQEILRSAHNFVLNFFPRLDNQKTFPGPTPLDYQDFDTYQTFNFNSKSSFLDLFHEAPFERTLYEHNSVLSFLKEKERINTKLIINFDELECQSHEETRRKNGRKGKNRLRSCHKDFQIYSENDSLLNFGATRTYNPRTLNFLSALKFRKTVQNHLFSPYPLEQDFLPVFLRAQNLLDRTFPILDFFCANLCDPTQKVDEEIKIQCKIARNFQKSDDFVRVLELTSRPNHGLFQLQPDGCEKELNCNWENRCVFLVPSNRFPKLNNPYQFQDWISTCFTPLHVYGRKNLSDIPKLLAGIQITGRLTDENEDDRNPWSSSSDEECLTFHVFGDYGDSDHEENDSDDGGESDSENGEGEGVNSDDQGDDADDDNDGDENGDDDEILWF